MSPALSDLYTPPSIEQIDAALDRFNDPMEPLGYRANYHSLMWGEGKIEVTVNEGYLDKTVAEFFTGTPGFLADFERYTEQTIDATSIPLAQIEDVIHHLEPTA